MATQFANGKIVTDGLVLCLDAADQTSYPTTGTTWFDLAGSYNGTLINGPTFNSNGASSSIVFDGVDDSCFIGGYPNLAISALTLSVWCYPTKAQDGTSSGRMIAAMTDVVGWRYGYGIYTYPVSGLGPEVVFYVGGGNPNVGSISYAINNNRWYNFVITFNGSNVIAYSNGVKVNETTGTLSYQSTNRFGLGDGYNYNAPYFGRISSTLLYNRALSPQEIQQNYRSQKNRFGLS